MLPGLEVDGFGELAFPLPAVQARGLIAVAETAPYGMGTKTVHDDSVRKCWQIDSARFSIKSASWKKFLSETIGQLREDFGINGKVSAHPYKLLVYGKGGHFKPHRDTEKLDAMFATLIIALPSEHEGGPVRHRSRQRACGWATRHSPRHGRVRRSSNSRNSWQIPRRKPTSSATRRTSAVRSKASSPITLSTSTTSQASPRPPPAHHRRDRCGGIHPQKRRPHLAPPEWILRIAGRAVIEARSGKCRLSQGKSPGSFGAMVMTARHAFIWTSRGG